MFHTVPDDEEMIAANVDEFGDSYCRDVNVEGLRKVCRMFVDSTSDGQICDSIKEPRRSFDKQAFISQLEDRGVDLSELPGSMFQRFFVYFDHPEADLDMEFAVELIGFGGGTVVGSIENITTHVVVGKDRSRLSEIRGTISRYVYIPWRTV
jgi:DNA ligase-4